MFNAAMNLDDPRGDSILAAMLRGATVLTPNVRTSRGLSRLYEQHHRTAGQTSWQPARIFSWSGWTASMWNDAILNGHVQTVLLNTLQEQALWIRILENSGDLGLQSSRSIARQCRHAMKLLGAYDLEDRFSRTAYDELSDATAFHSWYQEFLAVCKRESLLPASHLDVELSSLFRRNALAPDDEYILYGFDPLLPSQQTLLDAIVQSGATVHSIAARVAQKETPVIIACTDLHSEIEACCQWVNQTLVSDASGQVAIVVPDLTEWRPVLERSLRATVAPWLEDVTRHHDILPYEFSTGRPLSQLPMMADAMRLLQWCTSAASVDDAGAVLRSRSLALSPTPERGAELEEWCLRNTQRFRSATGLSGTITLREAERLLYKDDPTTSKALGELATAAAKQARGAHSYASLADHARALLDIAGWATCDLDSLEFQARERWNETLDRVSSLDLLGSNITFGEWLEMLAVTLNDTTFAPENTGARIQVMTPSEAAGSTSTHLWFLHASEQTWPQHASPSPLLPASLQRSLGMPGLDPLLDEAAALHVTRRCVDGASVTRFSFAAMLPTGESHVSPIVASLPNVDHQVAHTSKIATTLALEEVADVSPLPSLYGTAAGGVGILTEQAQCGFRAFAQHRLLTREMETIEAGLSAGERGDEVHTVLQAFWTVCKTHQRLLELSKTTTDSGMTARDVLLAECIAQALPQSPAPGWDTAYLEVQRKRLHRLLSDWLDLEMLRSPFRVEGLEVPVPEAHIGPLHMNIRVDRIDRIPMADGSEASLLIDYKTGGAERKDWFGERPDAPQLPLYAIAGGIPNVQGIAFGRVRVGKLGMNFEEIVADRTLLGNDASKSRRSEPPFEQRLAEWERDLTALAEAFARGEAVVEPKDYLTTCKRCSSRLLCRVDVARLEPDDDTLEEVEDEGIA